MGGGGARAGRYYWLGSALARALTQRRKSAEAFTRFVDFMYEHPQLMREFPKTIVFRDKEVELEFDERERGIESLR